MQVGQQTCIQLWPDNMAVTHEERDQQLRGVNCFTMYGVVAAELDSRVVVYMFLCSVPGSRT